MKTADLIPFILLELNECDKYGFELTKNIENKSNGKIIIKQPTLYTLLKKLEKSKFISSYWQDSEIGGKRHYYKLTQNGKLQVATLPSFDFLLNNALNSDDDIADITTSNDIQQKTSVDSNEIVNNPAPIETILPTTEVFQDSSIDTVTELEINNINTDILKDENDQRDHEFASSEDVSKFTEKTLTTNPTKEINFSTDSSTSDSILNIDFNIPKNEAEIKYVDFIDFKNTDNYKQAKNVAKKKLFQSTLTSLSMIIILAICTIITHFTSKSGLFYCFVIAGILIAIFYPLINLVFYDKIRFKYEKDTYNPKIKLKLFIGLGCLFFLLVVCIIVNICIGNNTMSKLLGWNNFKNIYAPIFISSVYFWDLFYNKILFSKIKK